MNNKEIAESLNKIAEELKKVSTLLSNSVENDNVETEETIKLNNPINSDAVEDQLDMEEEIIEGTEETPSNNIEQSNYGFSSYMNLTKEDFVKPNINNVNTNTNPVVSNSVEEVKEEPKTHALPNFENYNLNFDIVDPKQQANNEVKKPATPSNFGFTSLDDISIDIVNPNNQQAAPMAGATAEIPIENNNQTSLWGNNANN